MQINDHASRSAEQLALSLGWTMASLWNHKNFPLFSDTVLVVCPEHAKTFAQDGWSKNDLRQFLFDKIRRPFREVKPGVNGGEGAGISMLPVKNAPTEPPTDDTLFAKFPTLDTAAVKDRDVCLRYPIDERRPLWCHLYVAPKENVEFVTPASAVFQGRWPGQHRGGRRAVAGCVGGLAGCSLLNTATAFVPVSFGTARPPLSGQALHVANADRHGQCPNRC